jgi:hypothetical protein
MAAHMIILALTYAKRDAHYDRHDRQYVKCTQVKYPQRTAFRLQHSNNAGKTASPLPAQPIHVQKNKCWHAADGFDINIPCAPIAIL